MNIVYGAIGNIEIVSLDSTGGQENNNSQFPAMSSNGRFIAFESDATNLVAGDDINGTKDVFVKEAAGGIIPIPMLNEYGIILLLLILGFSAAKVLRKNISLV